MELTREDVERVVAAALAEDVGSGDATTLALVPEDARCRAELLLEEPGVVCGVAVLLLAAGCATTPARPPTPVRTATPATAQESHPSPCA